MYGMPIKAKRFYETAIEKGDKRPIVYYGLGRVLERKNEFDKAEAAFKNAIDRRSAERDVLRVARAHDQEPDAGPEERGGRRGSRMLALEVDPDNSTSSRCCPSTTRSVRRSKV